ncbi:ABC transporter ATP-binding protein [Corynebacterium rouxii]|uniref:ABC transporter ATP-binding protein n=1 Tax=Corynebacterium rouxii TaxID=2719119 RepID=A0A6I8M967_9CORY|nr:ABC transporter ATP-binding protein [Corynebacterium rouxii]VZH84077.1 ABC transporter ATP-binding protein [Corynebacterium rouxii]
MSLSISDLRVSYGRGPRTRHILNGVSFGPVPLGTVTGLLGPNAAGKSTLIKAIAGLKATSGGTRTIMSKGVEVPHHELRNVVGYVPQDLLTSASLTAFESILVSARKGYDPLLSSGAVMERLGITPLADRYVSELSGGQRQLVAVAQMLVRQPEVLLLDEPTSALDLRHQVELLKLLRTEVTSRECLAVVALHDLNLAARYCDHLVVLSGGHVIAEGAPKQVLTSDLLEQVYGLRARVLDDAGVPVVCPVED